MKEIIITDEDMESLYEKIDNMSQKALDSWTEYLYGVTIIKDNLYEVDFVFYDQQNLKWYLTSDRFNKEHSLHPKEQVELSDVDFVDKNGNLVSQIWDGSQQYFKFMGEKSALKQEELDKVIFKNAEKEDVEEPTKNKKVDWFGDGYDEFIEREKNGGNE